MLESAAAEFKEPVMKQGWWFRGITGADVSRWSSA
jgi:hypothetical protein